MNLITGFDHPHFFYAFAALAVLLALYWFYRRSVRKQVPAIFLWDRPESTPESGSRRQFRRLPLSFFLEALALILLVLAATAPFRMANEAFPALAVVLDNSFSMRAEGTDGASPRSLGEAELEKRLSAHPGRRVLLILAGNEPRLVSDGRERTAVGPYWTADEPAADLAGALALARSRCPGAELLIVTDRKPDFELAEDTGVFASGVSRGNAALVNARRRAGKILVEALNASSSERRVRLRLTPGGVTEAAVLAPGEQRKFVCRIPDSARGREVSVTLESDGDPLAFDNTVILLSEERPPLRFAYAADLAAVPARELDLVLESNPDFTRASSPELVFGGLELAPGNYHRFLWNPGGEGKDSVTAEPLAAQAGHPLTRGLGLQGVRWSAASGPALPGEVLIRRGDTELLSFRRRLDGYCDIYLNLAPGGSNLSRSPVWPALFWNIADFLRSERPGPGRRNCRSGEIVEFRWNGSDGKRVSVTGPDGSVRSVAPVRRRVLLAGLPPGISRIEAGKESWSVSVSALSAAESDLSGAGEFRRAPLQVAQMRENPRLPLGWIAFLLAAAVLLAHQYKLGVKRGGA